MNWLFSRRSSTWPKALALGSMAAFALMSCSPTEFTTGLGNGELPAELQPPENGVELLPFIEFHEASADLEEYLSIDEQDSVIVLTGPARSLADTLEMGHVFFGEAHNGFAVQVVEIRQSGDAIHVEYRPLALTNLIHGDWTEVLDLSGVAYEDADLSTIQQELVSEDWSFQFGSEGDLLQASGSAAIEITPDLRFDGKAHLRAFGSDLVNQEWGDGSCANALLDHNRWGTKAQICADFLHVSLGLHANAEAHARLEAEFSRGGVHERILLDRQYEDVDLVGPLALSAGVTVTARATGNGHGEGYLDYKADADLYAPLGFEWHHEEGLRGLTPIRDGDRNFNFESDAYGHVDLNASFTLEAKVHFSLSVKGLNNFVGFGGVGAEAKLHTEAQYLPLGELPCLSAGATFDSRFTGKLTAWIDASRVMLGTHDFTLVDVDHTFPTVDLFSWDDGGSFCASGDQRYAAELNRIYSQDCDALDNPFWGSCTDNLMRHCFNPYPGECQGYVDGNRNVLMVWPGGERVEMVRETAGNLMLDTSSYYGSEGDLCGTSELYVMENEPSSECGTEELFVLQQDQTPNDPHLDEEELEELYANGDLLAAGAEASACTNRGGGTVNMVCPNEEDNQSLQVGSQAPHACIVGIGMCSFQFVYAMPEASRTGAW